MDIVRILPASLRTLFFDSLAQLTVLSLIHVRNIVGKLMQLLVNCIMSNIFKISI